MRKLAILMLLAALTLTTGYTLIVLMTMLAPQWCRRGSAVWTLGMTMLALVVWLAVPSGWRIVPHPVYFLWSVSLVTFFLVALLDRRAILSRQDPVRAPGPPSSPGSPRGRHRAPR